MALVVKVLYINHYTSYMYPMNVPSLKATSSLMVKESRGQFNPSGSESNYKIFNVEFKTNLNMFKTCNKGNTSTMLHTIYMSLNVMTVLPENLDQPYLYPDR